MKQISFFEKIKRKLPIQKVDLVFFLFFLVAVYLIYNLYILQIIKGSYFNDKVLNQNRNHSNFNSFYRGTIFFQGSDDQKIVVATQKNGWTIAINPTTLRDKEIVFEKINHIIEINKEVFLKKASKINDPHEVIARRVSDEDALKIRNFDLTGVIFIRERWRHYPFNTLAAKTIGFVNIDNKGVYGLERYYENILKRDPHKKNRNIFLTLFSNKKINELFSQKQISKEGHIVSSINIDIQRFTENVLKKIDQEHNSYYSAAIIMKSSTGEIIAISDSRNFDLNQDKQDYRNIFVEHIFEVGSIFKPLIVAIGLENNAISSDFSYNDKGCVFVFRDKICNFDQRARGEHTNLNDIISKSLNLGVMEIGNKIGKKELFSYFIKLGLAEETGIDLPGEVPSNISSLNKKIAVNYATASFGQGIAFTPIGILRALNSLANNGFLVEPHLITKIKYDNLIPADNFIINKQKVFSPRSVNLVRDILVNRSDNSTLERKYRRTGYTAATKTGTAQIPDRYGGYKEDEHNHFF